MTAGPQFHIRSRDEADLYWSNEQGWGHVLSATKFDGAARNRVSLPIGGEWVDAPGPKVAETPTAIARIMTAIRENKAEGLELQDKENGWTMSKLRMLGDGLVDYSGRPTGRISISPEDIEARLRDGSLLEVGGEAMARLKRIESGFGWVDMYDHSFAALEAAQAPQPTPEAEQLVRIAAAICDDRGRPLDESTQNNLAMASLERIESAVRRLARDADYHLDDFAPDQAPSPRMN